MLYIMFTCLCLHFRDFQLFFLWILVWCMCVVRRGLWVCMPVVSSLILSALFLRRDLSLNLEFISSWACQPMSSRDLPSLYPNRGVWAYCVTVSGFYVVLGIQTQVLGFSWQGSYLLNHLPSPRFSTIYLSSLIALSFGFNYIFLDCRFKFPSYLARIHVSLIWAEMINYLEA